MFQTLSYLYLKLFTTNAMVLVAIAFGLGFLLLKRFPKKLYFSLLIYYTVAVTLVLVLTYMTFSSGGIGEYYLAGDAGYFKTIVFRAVTILLFSAAISISAIWGVKNLMKRRPLFAEGDEWKLGGAMLIASSGFFGNAIFYRLALLPFIYQEIFLLLVLIMSGLIGAALLSTLKKGKGRTNITPIILIIAMAIASYSPVIAGQLVNLAR